MNDRSGNQKENYNRTIYGCFIANGVQATVNNFVPLLFLTFQSSYGIPLSKITMLVTINFGLQLIIDFLAMGFVDKIGYRKSMLAAHVAAAAGLVSLTILPELFADPFIGLLLAVMIYAVGGGLLEVLVSPTVEACPTNNKEKAMSLLHSFYCWGHVGVVIISTLFFNLAGIANWKLMAMIWALLPVFNIFLLAKAPFASLIQEDVTQLSGKELLRQKIFWVFIVMMVCAGASEQSVSQWASAFAEKGLGVSKAIGDLAGPMAFAVLMGTARAIYGRFGDKINLERFMIFSAVLCIASYLGIALIPVPFLGLVSCGVAGFSVGIMWPGTFSKAAASIRGGGTAMFAFMALAGDMGCSVGPTLVGMVSGRFDDNLRIGILAAVIFPLLLLVGIRGSKRVLLTGQRL